MTLEYRRILFVAPEAELDVGPEIDSLESFGYDVRAVQGKVTSDRLFQIAATGGVFDILHFATHAGDAGIQLSGEVLTPGGLLQIARQTKAKAIFLNACETSDICHWLIDNEVPVAIGTLERIDDRVAKHTAQTFYHMLSGTNDLRMAYKLSRPSATGVYVFVTNGNYHSTLTQPIIDRIDRIEIALKHGCDERQNIGADVNRLRRTLRNAFYIFGTLQLFTTLVAFLAR